MDEMLKEELTPSIDDGSAGDEPMDYSELIEKEAFIGEFSFDVIKEGIETQFNNYVSLDDTTNYVEAFYSQLHQSYEAVELDEEEFHRDELREVLDNINDEFNSFIGKLFEQRLTLTLMDIENEDIDQEDIEYSVSNLYEYFILGARSNFVSAIYQDIKRKLHTLTMDDKEYFNTIREMLKEYSPLIIAMGPMEFIRYNKNDIVRELFDNGRVSGNFLRKYSPKLYDNEDLEVEIINQVTIAQGIRRDLTDDGTTAE